MEDLVGTRQSIEDGVIDGLLDILTSEKGIESTKSSVSNGVKLLLEKDLGRSTISRMFPQYFIQSKNEVSPKFDEKFTKHSRRYLNIFFEFLQKKYDESKGDFQEEGIRDAFVNFQRIIFIFGTTLSPDTFIDVLSYGIENNSLEEKHDEVKGLYLNISKVSGDIIGTESKNTLLSMVQHVISEGITHDGDMCFDKLNESIEGHFKSVLIKVGSAFSHWYNSTDLDEEFLNNLGRFINKLGDHIGILQDLGYLKSFKGGVSSTIQLMMNQKNKIGKVQFEKNEGELFIEFIDLAEKNKEKGAFISAIVYERSDNLNDYIKEESEDKINLGDVTFSKWQGKSPNWRIGKFYNEFIECGDNGEYSLIERYQGYISDLGNKDSENLNNLKGYLKPIFDSKYKGNENNTENFQKYISGSIVQIEDFKTFLLTLDEKSRKERLINFSETDFNTLNLLIGFWWYNLKEEDGSETKEIVHGMQETTITRLNNEGLLGKDMSFQFHASDNIKNTSAWNKRKILENLDTAYTKKVIDISTMGFEKDNKKRNFKDTLELYIPLSHGDVSITEVINYNHGLLKICEMILSGVTIQENDMLFLSIIKNLGIDITSLGAISELEIFLKFIGATLPDVDEMYADAGNDREDFIKIFDNPTFREKLGNDVVLDIGPPKRLDRFLEKVFSSKSGLITEIGDLHRMSITCDSLESLGDSSVVFMRYIDEYNKSLENNDDIIRQVGYKDYIGNITEKASKSSGYRDNNYALKFKSGNIMEVQFLLKDYKEFKQNGYNFGNESEFYKKVQKEFNLKEGCYIFSKEETEVLVRLTKNRLSELNLPEGFFNLCEGGKPESFDTEGDKLSSDTLYGYTRKLNENELFQAKISRIESLGYDIAGGRVLAKVLKGVLN